MSSAEPISIGRPQPPDHIPGPAAWYGRDLANADQWLRVFSAAEVAELEHAAGRAMAQGLPLVELDRAGFELPTLGPVFDRLRRDILTGRGFVLLRGLPVEGYSMEQAATIYWGIGCHFGHPVSQNAKGHLLGHVIDIGRSEHDPTARIYQTNARQFYHADSCDIVALMCLRKALRGGLSTIVSSVTLYNEMRRRHPELVGVLLAPMHVDRRGEVPEGANPWYELPVFNWHDGLLTSYYVRRYITSARRFDAVPALTERQIAAFDALDAIADDPDVHLSMAFEPGDIQLLHNHQIFHDRTGFEDHDDPDRRRHLLRLWLCPAQGRPLPPAYEQRWGSVEPGDRGGIRVKGATLVAPLEPE